MERIAVINGHIYLYWSSIVMTLAAAAAVCLFLALYLGKKRRLLAALTGIPLAIFLSLVLSRLTFWYFRPDSFENMKDAMNWQTPGEAALMGVFAGCMVTAVLLWILRLEKDLPVLLDCMAVAGCFGIGLGRLSSFFNTTARGMLMTRDMGLPWVVSTMNPVSGVMEYRLAIFLLQAVAAGITGTGLAVFYLTGKRRKGDTALLFLLFHSVSQVVLDSMRYDSLYLRSNGFVSIVQVLSACAIALTAVIFSVRLVQERGWRGWYPVIWSLLTAMIGLAGFMEYFVQRWSRKTVLGYSVMTAALLWTVVLILTVRHLAESPKRSISEA